jgi:hypothetical protein
VAVVNGAACTDKLYLYPVPPEDALTLEGLFTHFRIVFDSSVAVGDRVVESIGIANQRPLFINDEPTIYKKLVLNEAADGDRRVDIKVDLTDLLVDLKENVAWTPVFGADYDDGDQTFIYIKFPTTLRDTLNVGTIEIWKADSLYTTREIR